MVKTLLGYRSPSIDDQPTSSSSIKKQQSLGTSVPPPVRLFPSRPPPVFNGERFVSFALFETNVIPESVTIKCNSPDGPLEVTLPISMEDDVFYHGSFARKMVARAAISECEDTMRNYHQYHNRYYGGSSCDEQRRMIPTTTTVSKSEALKLALDNGLVSEQTSYIAILEQPVVEAGESVVKKVTIPQHLPGYNNSNGSVAPNVRSYGMKRMLVGGGRGGGCWGGGGKSLIQFQSRQSKPPMMMDMDAEETTRRISGSYGLPAPSVSNVNANVDILYSSQRASRDFHDESAGGWEKTKLTSKGKVGSAQMKQSVRERMKERAASDKVSTAAPTKHQQIQTSPSRSDSNSSTRTNDDPLLSLCVLQKADGSFLLNNDLASALGLTSEAMNEMTTNQEFQELVSKSSSNSSILSTLMAIVALRIRFMSSKDVWELQEQKAMSYLQVQQGLQDTDITSWLVKVERALLLLSESGKIVT